MSKLKVSKPSLPVKGKPFEAPAQKLAEQCLAGVSPLREQFEPTDAVPIRQRARMGGAGKVG